MAQSRVEPLLEEAQTPVFLHGEEISHAPVALPIAVYLVVVGMIPGPSQLRHRIDQAEQEAESPIQPAAAEQGVVPLVVHQRKATHREQAQQQDQRR